jgi:hypothetical protein
MTIFRERLLLIQIAISTALLLVALGLIILNIGDMSPQIILHYDAFHGVDDFGAKTDIWWIWGITLVMVAMNLCLANRFYDRMKILSYIFVGANIILSLLTLIAIATIVSVN